MPKGQIPWNRGKKGVQICSEETRKKMSIAHSGEKNHNFGKPMPESVKKKLSDVIKLQYATGRVQSEQQRKKNSSANTGRKRTPETCRKIGDIHKGKIVSKETRLKLHDVHKGLQSKEKHPRWKGGITPLMTQIRNCEKSIEIRNIVIKRDGYSDFYSGTRGGDLEVHHIVPMSVMIEIHEIRTFEDAINCAELFDADNCITMSKTNHAAHHDLYGKDGQFFRYLCETL